MRDKNKYEAPEIEVTRFEVRKAIMSYPEESGGDIVTDPNPETQESDPDTPELGLDL